MTDWIRKRYKRIDLEFLKRAIYVIFAVIVLILTLMICLNSPVQRHFNNLRKNDVWFGDKWYYTEDGEHAAAGSFVTAKSQHYLKVFANNGRISITKTLDFKPSQEEYLCFRARALTVRVYVNGNIWYKNEFPEEYRQHGRRMYMLHQAPAYGMQEGDQITIELETASGEEYDTIQYPSLGDRYALTKYILEKSQNSIAICFGISFLILLNVLTIRSTLMADKAQNKKSLLLLICFLVFAMVYISTDSGYMEIFTERMSILSWYNNLSMILLPIPLMLFIKNTFFPGHIRYEVLALAHLLLNTISIGAYVFCAISISDFYLLVHIMIGIDILVCIISFFQEKMGPPMEVLIGFGTLIITVLASIASYWEDIVYPCSILFGYGLLIFAACMLFWIVRSRHELDSMREEVDHVFMQRETKAAQEASEHKSRFLSHMSHEIRTPLNAILGMNELIMHDTDNNDIKRYSAAIQSAGMTLLALLNDVLDYSKIETGKMDIIESHYSLSSLLNDVVLMIQGKASDKGLELRLDIDATLPDLLRGDEIRIKQILTNLMSNAVKYTKEGWLQLTVGQQRVSRYLDDNMVMLDIKVSDSGMGIKEEEMHELFTEFERLDRQKNKGIEGSGLGLSITSHLVSLMKGSINVESQYGRGSTFIVQIPQTVISEAPIGDYKKRFEVLSNADCQETPEILTFPGKTVFVVDDNELNLEVISSILEMFEVHVERADSGQAAIERLDKEVYDLILTDDMMPHMNGTEMMQYLHKNVESASNKTPIVVLTANAVAGAREEYINKGFDDYMSKPIDADVLQKILMKYLK